MYRDIHKTLSQFRPHPIAGGRSIQSFRWNQPSFIPQTYIYLNCNRQKLLKGRSGRGLETCWEMA